VASRVPILSGDLDALLGSRLELGKEPYNYDRGRFAVPNSNRKLVERGISLGERQRQVEGRPPRFFQVAQFSSFVVLGPRVVVVANVKPEAHTL